MAITPEVLPPEAGSKSATQMNLVDPLSRRKFREKYRWAFITIKKLETIAYYTIPLYRKGVTKAKERFEGQLTGYHQWVLLQIRIIALKQRNLEQTAEIVRLLEEGGAFTPAQYCKDWINWI